MAKTRIERRCDIRDVSAAKYAIVDYCRSIGYELVQHAGNRIAFRFTRAKFWATKTSDYWHRLTVTLTGASVLCEFGGWMNPDKALGKSSTDFDRIATGIAWAVDASAKRTTYGAGESVWVSWSDGGRYPGRVDWADGNTATVAMRDGRRVNVPVACLVPRDPTQDGAQRTSQIIERQVVVTRCKFCHQLTPVDLERCNNCGAMKFA